MNDLLLKFRAVKGGQGAQAAIGSDVLGRKHITIVCAELYRDLQPGERALALISSVPLRSGSFIVLLWGECSSVKEMLDDGPT